MDDDLHSIADSACDVDREVRISFPSQGGWFGTGISTTLVFDRTLPDYDGRTIYRYRSRLLVGEDPPAEHMPDYNRAIHDMQQWMEENP